MPTPISTLPLAELAEMYDHAWLLKRAMQMQLDKTSTLPVFLWQHISNEAMRARIKDLKGDMDLLWQAMEQKIPSTHMFEIKRMLHDTRNH
jgi:hypothetical protein